MTETDKTFPPVTTDQRVSKLVHWIKESSARAPGLLIPVSGGSDSALAFYLANLACPEKTVGVFMGGDLRCRDWFERTGKLRLLPHANVHNHPEVDRFAAFLAMALNERRWLVGTRNRSEECLGTFSTASRLATYLPLAGLWKSEVLELCTLVGVPEVITASSRRADPDCGRPSELAEIPLELIDIFLKVRESVISGNEAEAAMKKLSGAQIEYLDRVYASNQFKRRLPTCGPATS